LRVYAEKHGPETGHPERIAFAADRLLDWWGDRCVDAILPETCRLYRNARLKAGVKTATAGRELSTLRAALIWSHRNGYLVSVPAVECPPTQPGKDRWLTRQEIARLLREARREPKSRLHLPLFILLALYTGARRSALLELQWTQIDFVRGFIDLNPAGRPQTKKRRARVPMPRQLRWFLLRAQARTNCPYVLNYHGEPLKQVRHSFANACARAGLDGVTGHTLRHTCGTWLAQAGVPLWQISGWLGHTMAATTELYAHHHPDHLGDARAALERRRQA
jgi:integrase